MTEAAERGDIDRWETLRSELLVEGEVLKAEFDATR